MSIRYCVTGHDLTSAPDILRTENETGKYVVRPEYADLACKRCRKMDERAAYLRGFESVPKFRTSRSIFPSRDGIHIGNEIIRNVFSDLFPGEFDFFSIFSAPTYCVLDAKNSIKPSVGDRGYRFLGQCTVCGRYEQLLWNNEPIRIPDRNLVSIDLEGRISKRQAWLVPKVIAETLDQHKPLLKGICLSPVEVTLE